MPRKYVGGVKKDNQTAKIQPENSPLPYLTLPYLTKGSDPNLPVSKNRTITEPPLTVETVFYRFPA